MLEDNIVFKQYYHLVKDNINAMLNHWTKWQANSKLSFCFKHTVLYVQVQDYLKKKTEKKNDTNSSMALEEAEDNAKVNITLDKEVEDNRQYNNSR